MFKEKAINALAFGINQVIRDAKQSVVTQSVY